MLRRSRQEIARELMARERENLRNELQFLKNCQVQYFVLSITAAGAIAGFGKALEGNHSVYLAPLLVILPCWWIFFDKGTTISRIVAYLRILEGLILSTKASAYTHCGWENALSLFRTKEHEKSIPERAKHYLLGLVYGFWYGLTFHTTHTYWSINWYTFFGLGLSALWLSRPASNDSLVSSWTIFLLLFCVTAIHNLSVLGRLVKGSYSFEHNFRFWQAILK